MERKYYEIVDHPHLIRDAHSKGLILRDKSVLKREAAKKKNRQEFDDLKRDVEVLKDKVDDIHGMLRILLNKEGL